MCIHDSISLFPSLPLSFCFCLSVCLSVCLSFCVSVSLSFCLSVCLSVCLSLFLRPVCVRLLFFCFRSFYRLFLGGCFFSTIVPEGLLCAPVPIQDGWPSFPWSESVVHSRSTSEGRRSSGPCSPIRRCLSSCWKFRLSAPLRGPSGWCDTRVFFSVSPRPPLPLPGTGSGRKRGMQPPTPVLCTCLGVAARVL